MSITVSNQGRKTRLLTLDRPPVDALDDETVSELPEAVKTAMSDPEVGALVITGAGGIFVAGADVEKLAACNREEGRRTVVSVKAMQSLLRKGPKPVIAALNGMAGGGLELAMACDIRIADKEARMGLPEANLGVIPGAGGTQMLPRLVGIGKALELMLSGRVIKAKEALDLGLVDRIAGEEGLWEKPWNWLKKYPGMRPLPWLKLKGTLTTPWLIPLKRG